MLRLMHRLIFIYLYISHFIFISYLFFKHCNIASFFINLYSKKYSLIYLDIFSVIFKITYLNYNNTKASNFCCIILATRLKVFKVLKNSSTDDEH